MDGEISTPNGFATGNSSDRSSSYSSLTNTPNASTASQNYDFDREFELDAITPLAGVDHYWSTTTGFHNLGSDHGPPSTIETILSSVEVDQFFSEESMRESNEGVYQQSFDLGQPAFDTQALARNNEQSNQSVESSDFPTRLDGILDKASSPTANTPPPSNANLIDMLLNISEEDLEHALSRLRTRDPGTLPRNMTSKLRRLNAAFKPARVSKRTSSPITATNLRRNTPIPISRNNTPRWWSRFLDVTPSNLTLSADLCDVIEAPAQKFVDYAFSSTSPTMSTLGETGSSYLSTRILQMRAISSCSTHLTILSHAHCLFFHIYSFGSLSAWLSHFESSSSPSSSPSPTTSRSSRYVVGNGTRTPKLRLAMVSTLYSSLAPFLPASLSEEEFRLELRTWRHIGSCLSFFAQHVGLGGVMLLTSAGKLGARAEEWRDCSKGGEKEVQGEIWRGGRPSEVVFAKLRGMGVGIHGANGDGSKKERVESEQQARAEDFMHRLLWEMFRGVPDFFDTDLRGQQTGVFFKQKFD